MKRMMLLFLLLSNLSIIRADEGMWLLGLIKRLNYIDMQKQGLKLTLEEIYSVDQSSLKDAIVDFGGFCTGGVVSDQGLIFTNYHCGYENVASLSSAKNDYIRDGFWAYKQAQELKVEDLYVRFLIRMGDVTDRIQKKLGDVLLGSQRETIIQSESREIERELSENGKYDVEVKPFFKGSEFYYFLYQRYSDIRLVGVPPSSIGKFGGDSDNWEWPRHTGDFAIFRVYADKDGNPAGYFPDNVPLKPKRFLPISLRGVKVDDFSMILGFPGNTDRYMPSWGIEQAINVEYPAWVESSKNIMDVIKKHMDRSDKVRINYTAHYEHISNYWKNRLGMIESICRNRTVDHKKALEEEFKTWYLADEKRKARYGDVFKLFQDYYRVSDDAVRSQKYAQFVLKGTKIASALEAIYSTLNTIRHQATSSKEKKEKVIEVVDKIMDEYYDRFDLEMEQDILAAQLKVYHKRVPETYQADVVKAIYAKYEGDFKKFAQEAFASSVFRSKDALSAFLYNPSPSHKDPLIDLYQSIAIKAFKPYENFQADVEKLKMAYRLFIEGLREMKPEKPFYPDANFSMRFTYGQVKALPPNVKNDTKINYYTTLKGAVAKYRPQDKEFDLPERLLQFYEKKDYGPYADQESQLPINFLTNNDITGGNSGSPVLNAQGMLIGLAFDGNWEAMSGDIEFEKNKQRTIVVDARYILFIIDRFAGAKNLIQELKIVQ